MAYDFLKPFRSLFKKGEALTDTGVAADPAESTIKSALLGAVGVVGFAFAAPWACAATVACAGSGVVLLASAALLHPVGVVLAGSAALVSGAVATVCASAAVFSFGLVKGAFDKIFQTHAQPPVVPAKVNVPETVTASKISAVPPLLSEFSPAAAPAEKAAAVETPKLENIPAAVPPAPKP